MRRNKNDRRDRRPRKGGGRFVKEERSGQHRFAGEKRPQPIEQRQTLSQLEAVERLLSGIGVPEEKPFAPDAFQLEALAAIEHEDVLVTAPTGSGKTWIAREEIRRLLGQGKRAWYTTPLKALTNSKYTEFGLQFGDRKENADAPLIVGTTEIYRNQVFDAMRSGEQVRTDFVIIDEAHYLADEDRGHVWEETIILTPPRIRLLLLSATVGKAEEFAKWIEEVRGTHVRVVKAGPRPVELRAAYLSTGLQLYPLFDEEGWFNRDVEQFTKERRNDFRRRR